MFWNVLLRGEIFYLWKKNWNHAPPQESFKSPLKYKALIYLSVWRYNGQCKHQYTVPTYLSSPLTTVELTCSCAGDGQSKTPIHCIYSPFPFPDDSKTNLSMCR